MVDEPVIAGGGDGASDRPLNPISDVQRSVALRGESLALRNEPTLLPGERLVVGAMSGTSADGVDVALCAISGRGREMTCRLLALHHERYDDWIRTSVFAVRQNGQIELRNLARLARDCSMTYARAVTQLLASQNISPGDVAAIAAHGQTLFHAPPCTIQWLDPALLAAETRIAVVSDFRRADCAAGGQGAPLVPFADYVLFRDPEKTRVLLNIGGIANVTYLPAGDAGLANVQAFDTGPGNCVTDHLMRLYDPEGPGYDAGGLVAGRGQPIYQLIHLMLSDPYFSAPAPKSTDGPAMIDVFARAYAAVGRKFPFENLLKTACLLTATTIADAIRRFDPFPDELIVSGGGIRNECMMTLLRQPLGDLPIRSTDDFGIPVEAKEAVAFALLGAATLDGEPGNVLGATGAKRAVVLGSITPRP